MFLHPLVPDFIQPSLPRIRGGVSTYSAQGTHLKRSSPHTRGCFQSFLCVNRVKDVFPAYAGVFLLLYAFSCVSEGLPRIRGGVSSQSRIRQGDIKSSPHTRGCFPVQLSQCHLSVVFPAYAGVFLSIRGLNNLYLSLPRIRGGVSIAFGGIVGVLLSSPHTRGCFHDW